MGKKGPMAVVTPAEWRERTSLTFSSRNGAVKALDDAYDYFHANQSSRGARRSLYGAIKTYVTAHGGWDRCERDKVSGGLLTWLFAHTSDGMPAAGTPEHRDVQAQAARRAIRDTEIPHSRYGVLYLLGGLRVKLDYVPMVIESVSLAGGAIGAGFATDTSQLHSSELAARQAFGGITGHQVISGGQGVARIAGAVTATPVAKPKAPLAPEAELNFFPHTVSELEGAVARMGNVEALMSRHRAGYATTGAVLLGAGVVSGVRIAGAAVVDVGLHAYQGLRYLASTIGDALSSVWESIQARMLANGSWLAEKIASISKLAIKFVLNKVLSHALPFLGGAIDIGTGLVRTIRDAGNRIQSYLDRKRFELVAGHPEEIANSIESAMTKGIFKGLADMLKGSASVALSVLLPGLGSLVAAAVSGLEWLCKFCLRIWEWREIKDFLKVARQHYADAKGQATRRPHQDRAVAGPHTAGHFEPDTNHPFLRDTAAFTAFFRKGCEASPLIPMLVLNSGVCGSLMTMMRMFKDAGLQDSDVARMVGQSEHDAGERYFTRLKRFGATYLQASGMEFTVREDADPAIEGLLRHAVRHHQAPHSKMGKFVAVLAS